MRDLIVFLLLCSFFSTAFAQRSEDCVDAHVITDTPILLSDIADITVDKLLGSGTEPAEIFDLDCAPDSYSSRAPDNSYWFAFSATTSGTLEFMITPNGEADYDFAVFEGFCPNDPCNEPIFCAYQFYLCDGMTSVAVADDPLTTFGADPNVSLNFYQESIPLKAENNYYILVENRRDTLTCQDLDYEAGFTINFEGTATIDELLERPTIEPKFPKDTSEIIYACEGDILGFSVTQVPNAINYDWNFMSVSDAIITPNALGDSVSVKIGKNSGLICMEMTCPIQSLICWNIAVDGLPDLQAISAGNTSCASVDLSTRFTDNNPTPNSTVAYYETEQDAMNDLNPLPSSIVGARGNYWAKKTTPNGCTDQVQMRVVTEKVEIEPIEMFRTCGATFYDFRDLSINNTNGDAGDLAFIFYEDSLNAVNRTNAISPPVVYESGKYWARAEKQASGSCFDIKPFEFRLDPQIDILPISPQEFCNNSCLDLKNIALEEANGQDISIFNLAFYNNEADALEGALDKTLTNTEICESGTFWIRVFSSASCFDIAQIELTAFLAPDIADVTLTIDCEFGCENLADLVLTERNGLDQADLTYSYFTTFEEASDPTATPISDLNICEPTELWVRVAYTSGCFDEAKVTIEGLSLTSSTLSGDAAICQGDNTNLELVFSGDGPFTIIYTDGMQQDTVIATTNTFSTPVSPAITTTYTLVAITDGGGCKGSIEGAATVIVNNPPTIQSLSQDCNGDASEYTIRAELEGGDPVTYQVDPTGISGSIVDNTVFISDPIPTGGTYTIIINDESGCATLTESGSFSCECNSEVGKMDTQPVRVCEREPAIGFYLGGDNIAEGDVLHYVLHDRPDTILGNVVANSEESIFVFDENTMTYGVTYYLSAIITKTDLIGNPVLSEANNTCLRTSAGTPVIFYYVPEISLSLSNDFTCIGEPVDLIFNMEGVGPYDINYFDGEKISTLMGVDSGHIVQVSPELSASFFVQTIVPSGVPNCRQDFLDMRGSVSLTVRNAPVIENFEIICNTAATKLVFAFDITGGNPATYEVKGVQGVLTGNRFVSDSIMANTPYQIKVIDENNCTPILLQGIAECNCPPDILASIEVVEPVSCRGEKDAILKVEAVNGKAPFAFRWSTGAESTRITNIAAGLTSVTMTDGNGCEIVSSIMLEEPRSITASANVEPITCYEANDGGILVINVQGGTGEYTYSFNEAAFRVDNYLGNLKPDIYTVGVKDENGCTWSNEVTIEQPIQLDVKLGDNLTLNLGESLTLSPQINQEAISIEWEAEDSTICADCLNPVVQPNTSTRYKVTVINSSGCIVSDQVLVQVRNDRRVYIPSAFSPNGDGHNDILSIYGGTEVQDILMFRVYNRWGELVYELKNMPTESDLAGWNGREMSGKEVPVGVYLYYTEIVFKNGTSDIITGDVNLIR